MAKQIGRIDALVNLQLDRDTGQLCYKTGASKLEPIFTFRLSIHLDYKDGLPTGPLNYLIQKS
jgi:hypothetical protein